ncbi:MAG: hypothetical protein PF541_07220 [Prolixibacteraceae bacterium]|nr:hypothetical protein [Prolixibacteraceae bacterium]
MKNILTTLVFIILLAGIILTSCEEENYISGEDAYLSFSIDTLMFDTIFTTVGSTTQSFRVINPHNQPILISSIELAGAEESNYRMNIDGKIANVLYDIEIPARDSIFIFVEVTVDPNGSNQPMIVQDSIQFTTDSNLQDIDILAWGQDFVPINKEVITTTTWTAEKPYLVYEYAYVDSGEVLTIEPGARIYFHKNAGLYGKGAISAVGTFDEPIIFSGDRLEHMYYDIPDQWSGILLFPNETPSEFENVEISNANIGLQVGAIEYEGSATVRLHNVKIEHMAFAGILALSSNIEASNTVVANCGYYCVSLLVGGTYSFNHCTIANYWGGPGYPNREKPSVSISNNLIVTLNEKSDTLHQDLFSVWRNSIIYGNFIDTDGYSYEIEYGYNDKNIMGILFENCLLKDTADISNIDIYPGCIKNKDPLFVNKAEYNFELDSASAAQNLGLLLGAELVPFDLNNNYRLEDKSPDIGAYERVKEEEEEE